MPVYKVTRSDFEPLERTSFERESIQERGGIQARLRDRPEILEEGLYILAEEFQDFEDSNRRIDLLALDAEGRLVVVELKRSDQDSFMDLQAIRYAGMVSGMTMEQATDAHRRHLESRGQDGTDAESRIQQQLTGDDAQADIDSTNPRIILASGNFSNELTASALWLNKAGVSVTCVKLELYRSGDDFYMEGNRVIPLPKVEGSVIKGPGRGQSGTTRPPVTYPGGDEFRKAVETARTDARDYLMRLYKLAVSLEEGSLAELSTRVGSYNTVLRVRLPGSDQALFYVYRNQPGYGYLQFSGPNLERRAPRSKERLEWIIDGNIGHQSTLWDMPEGFLDALANAYREAAGQELDDAHSEEHDSEAEPPQDAPEEDNSDSDEN